MQYSQADVFAIISPVISLVCDFYRSLRKILEKEAKTQI